MVVRGAPLRVIIIRPDNIGDVVLSTPVFETIKKHYPNSHLTVMVCENVVPLIKGLPSVDDVFVFDPLVKHAGIAGFFRLMSDLRRAKYRVAVVLKSNRRIASALFGAGIRHRVGPLSKFHSFLFYNRGVRQRRSEVEMHEADYNLQLLRKLGIRIETRTVLTRVSLSDQSRQSALGWLKEHGLTPRSVGENQDNRLIVVHPGMKGSALNWPEGYYAELIKSLALAGFPVLVTGGASEESLLIRLKEWLELNLKKETRYKPAFYHGRPDAESLGLMSGLISWAGVVVAPSTGPLHIAAAIGRRIVTFYSPIRVQSAIRWGPYVADESRTSILVPEVYCGQDFTCRGNLCNYYSCMKSITVSSALEHVYKQLTKAQEAGEEVGGA